MQVIMSMPLRRLLDGVAEARIRGDADVAVTSISVDSRAVEPGALFVCLRGARADGHDNAAAAVRNGAVAIVTERDVALPPGTPEARVPNALAALSPIAAAFYDYPSDALTCVGVTGTNGKTTTTYLLEAIMSAARRPFGLVGTLGARFGQTLSEALAQTTPFAHETQRLLARFRNAGALGAIIEVSSHALSLHRVDDVDFDVAVLTNVTHDHLDFHGTFQAYRDAKRTLFERTARGGRKPAGTCVLNLDDEEGRRLAQRLGRVLTYAVSDSDAHLRASEVSYGEITTFSVRALRPAPFALRLPGPYNVANAIAAIAAACALDVDVEAIAEGIEAVHEVPGRMTHVTAGDIAVFVDFAHTPDSLRNALGAARSRARNRVLCVFGCGGDRDPHKRPIMGAIAQELADFTYVTSDNPRFEDPQAILADIVRGMRDGSGGSYEVIADRRTAIERAIEQARPGDVVLIAGKGHEAYQLIGEQRLPFSDVAVAQDALRKVGA